MKKILIGIYCFIIIGIIVIVSNSHIFSHKDSKAIAAGEKIYNRECMGCHGVSGKGEGKKSGTALNNQNLLSSVSDKDLFNYVKYGRGGTGMPAFGPRLSRKELQHLVAFMRNWQTKQIQFDAPKTFAGKKENGVKLYNLYCSNCHGAKGTGMAEMGPSLSNLQYLKYTSNQQIWIASAYGREETRMGPSLNGLDGVRQLKKSDLTDIVSYIRSLKPKTETHADHLKP